VKHQQKWAAAVATSAEEENLAKTTMPPLEKITAFHTEPPSPSSILSPIAANGHRGDSRDHRDNTDDVNDKHCGTVRT